MGNPLLWLLGKVQGLSDEEIASADASLQAGQSLMNDVNTLHSQGAAAQDIAADPLTQTAAGKLSDASAPLLAQLKKAAGPDPASLVANADADRGLGSPLLATLKGQAATGGGAWEDQLAQSTRSAVGQASGLGLAQQGVSAPAALRNIANAQNAAAQQSTGQANELRAEQQQAATGLYDQMLRGQGGVDAAQAENQAGLAQQQRAANAALTQGGKQNTQGLASGVAQAGMAALSSGGSVPGTPEVFGDDSRNDTVPAWLSPKEIVLPLSVTQAPDAPERAAAFVRSVKGQAHPSHSSQHFDDGGQVTTPGGVLHTPIGNFSNPFASDIQAPSVKNGALLDTGTYDANRTAVLSNQQTMGTAAAGGGPSAAGQVATDAADAAARAALGGAPPSASGAALLGATGASQRGAGQAAALRAGEQGRAEASLAESLLGQRRQDLALAEAQQRALRTNTNLNMGLDLSQQAMLRNMLGGAAQGLAGYTAGGGGLSSDSNDYAGRGSPSDLTGGHTDTFAAGGEVGSDEKRRADAFLAALQRAA